MRKGLGCDPGFDDVVHWFQRNDTPDPIGCNPVFAEDLPTIREVVYMKPRLFVKSREGGLRRTGLGARG